MYIISMDLGSTNYKAMILKIENDNITVVAKEKERACEFNIFINKILDKYRIDITDVEKIILTGTGASLIQSDNVIKEISEKIIKINEFDAIGYGGLVLAKKEEGIVVSIGTGTAIVYSDLVKNVYLGGTGLGGGTFVGICARFLQDGKCKNFQSLIDFAKTGDSKNVDLLIKDINTSSIENLTSDITAANFAAIDKKSTEADFVAGVANMIAENICLLTNQIKKNALNGDIRDKKLVDSKSDIPIIFIGTLVTDSYIKKCIIRATDFTKDTCIFVDNSDYAITIGAYEYYMLRERKVV